ncbi:DUF742 domain-containing protein [Streptomyces sp. NPDC051704]|uniref:DUF742 domain-containing protein n=1 Tax=Streptomyces sp. NPDC051704 TaxID=3365671 RepID=UPI0037B2C98F
MWPYSTPRPDRVDGVPREENEKKKEEEWTYECSRGRSRTRPAGLRRPRGRRPGSDRTRPYTITAGRTVIRLELPLEALVVTGHRPQAGTGQPEHDRILALCVRPVSVAEVSARLEVPLGVARVLLSDLCGTGLVSVVDPAGERPTTALMERVLSGLHRI